MDITQFSERVRTCEPKLYHVAISLLPCEADCADAIQETLVKAWRKLDTLRHDEYFETWLIRILINECRGELRRRYRRAECELSDNLSMPQPPDPKLRQALMALNVKYRLPLVLYYLHGYDKQLVSQILRLPLTTVKGRLYRARLLLREQLKKEDVT